MDPRSSAVERYSSLGSIRAPILRFFPLHLETMTRQATSISARLSTLAADLKSRSVRQQNLYRKLRDSYEPLLIWAQQTSIIRKISLQ